jgi:multidrug efflux system membrane fusion protein
MSAMVLAGGTSIRAQGEGTSAGVHSQGMYAASYDAHTEPSRRSKVNFAAPGVVAQVIVKEGDAVKEGQPLIRLDDRGDKHLLDSLELEAKSDLKIQAAQADLKQKKVELERKRKSFEGGGATQTEVDEAEINVLIKDLTVQVEELTRKQKELEAKRQSVKVEQMTVRAPFDGVVEKIDLSEGETPDAQKPAIYVVKNDVLWVNVNLPTSLALKLKMGDELDVRYKDLDQTVKGKVIFLSPFADAASETRIVRLELSNAGNLPAGLSVAVLTPGSVAGTASR